ncbi:MAG: rhodanese-like domain-containing protein [Flavobacteriaceae bacterium]
MRFFIAIFCFIGLMGCHGNTQKIETIMPKAMHELMQNEKGLVIDVRTPTEYQTGHLKNAVNIDFKSPDFVKNINKLNKTQPVYVYCRSGNRSGKSLAMFKAAGFSNVYNLDGGILKWEAEGLEVVNKIYK